MAQVEGVFEAPLQEAIQGSKILVVGAGGIGCELLKNIVLSGKQIFNSPTKKQPHLVMVNRSPASSQNFIILRLQKH